MGETFFIGRQEMRLQTPLGTLILAHAFLKLSESCQLWVALCRKEQDPRGSQVLEVILLAP